MNHLTDLFISFICGFRACQGKINFKSQVTATRAKVAMEKKSAPKLFDAYLCFWCRGWHIGGKFSLKGLIQRRFREVSRLLRFK